MDELFKDYKRVWTDYQSVAIVTRENMIDLAEKFKGRVEFEDSEPQVVIRYTVLRVGDAVTENGVKLAGWSAQDWEEVGV